MAKKFIITTNLEKKFIKSVNSLYLGDWCLNANEIKKRTNIKSTDLENYNYYLGNLVQRLSVSLALFLNKQNKKKFNKNFWQNLIWVWLSYYVSAYFYRWKQIHAISKGKKLNFLNLNFSKEIYVDGADTFFRLVSNSDKFNYIFIRKIIFHLRENFKFVQKKNCNFDFGSFETKNRISLIKLILNFYSKISSLISYENKIFISSCFSMKNLIKINLKLFQLPQFFSYYFMKKPIIKIANKKIQRNEKLFKFSHKNSFEFFIKNNIINDIPLNYIENFDKNFENVKKINLNPNIILVGGEHYHNENFKLWALYKKYFKRKKIISVEHGGNHQINSGQYNYDKKFSNITINWINKFNKFKLPNPRIYNDFIKRKNTYKVTYVGFEKRLYPARIGDSVYNVNNFKTYENIKILKEKLKKNIYEDFYYSPKYIHDNRLKRNLISLLGKNKILRNESFKKNLKTSKIVICDYPQTSFLEAITTGPTFLICDYTKNFIPIKEFKKIYYLMEKNNIIFKNVNLLANFINKNWDNVEEIWNSKNVQKTKNEFVEKFSVSNKYNILNSWKKFLSNY